jgi:hypothetical protein
MTYIKIGQILDEITSGHIYLEDENQKILISNNPKFPLSVSVEVIDWGTEANQLISGPVISFNAEIMEIIDQSIPIRQSVFNQLISKYPTLVI